MATQKTEQQLTTEFDVIRSETVERANTKSRVADALDNLNVSKVSKEAGKGLSTNDFTNAAKAKVDAIDQVFTAAEKTKLTGVQSGATANSSDAQLRDRSTHTGTQTSATISDFVEAVQDAVAALLGAGSNVIVNYDDAANTLTISATGGDGSGLSVEDVRDAIGAAIVGVGDISVAYNDALDTITISTTATQNSTDAALRDRSTHTGTQLASTISDFAAAVNALLNGYATDADLVAAMAELDASIEEKVLDAVEDVEYIYPSFIPVANAAHTITPEAPYIAATASTAPVPLTAPSLASGAGRWFKIRVIAASEANPVTLIGQFNGATNYVITEPGEANFFADATTYRISWVPDSISTGADGEDGEDGADGVGVPAGGTAGQILAKNSNDDFDTEWIDAPEGGGGGGTDLSSFPVFIATHSGDQWLPTNSFQKIALGNVAMDSHEGWDAVNNWYEIPQNGVYRIEMKFRLADGYPANKSVGIGAHIIEEDNAAFFWQSSGVTSPQGAYRHGILNQRVAYLTAGAQIRLYGYFEEEWEQRNVIAAVLTIDRIR